jgi:hypothetical protein
VGDTVNRGTDTGFQTTERTIMLTLDARGKVLDSTAAGNLIAWRRPGAERYGSRPEMVFFNAAKINRAGPEAPPFVTVEFGESLNTYSEGDAEMLTCSEILVTAPVVPTTAYRVAVLVPWPEIQYGIVGPQYTPQG